MASNRNLAFGKGEVGSTSMQKCQDGPSPGNPFFPIILTKAALDPDYLLVIPPGATALLPEDNVDAILKRGDKEWNVTYYGIGEQKMFDKNEWSNFARDNDLEVGDGCVFEITQIDGKKVTMDVIILTGEFPPQLLLQDDEY